MAGPTSGRVASSMRFCIGLRRLMCRKHLGRHNNSSSIGCSIVRGRCIWSMLRAMGFLLGPQKNRWTRGNTSSILISSQYTSSVRCVCSIVSMASKIQTYSLLKCLKNSRRVICLSRRKVTKRMLIRNR